MLRSRRCRIIRAHTHFGRSAGAGSVVRREGASDHGAVHTGDESLAVIGRSGELASIEAVIAAAQGGSGSVLIARGEAGIGKTRLLEVGSARARTEGLAVVSCSGDP